MDGGVKRVGEAAQSRTADKAGLNSLRPRCIRWHKQHIPVAQQFFSADSIKNSPRVRAGGNGKGDPRWEVGLDQPGNHIHGWTLGR